MVRGACTSTAHKLTCSPNRHARMPFEVRIRQAGHSTITLHSSTLHGCWPAHLNSHACCRCCSHMRFIRVPHTGKRHGWVTEQKHGSRFAGVPLPPASRFALPQYGSCVLREKRGCCVACDPLPFLRLHFQAAASKPTQQLCSPSPIPTTPAAVAGGGGDS